MQKEQLMIFSQSASKCSSYRLNRVLLLKLSMIVVAIYQSGISAKAMDEHSSLAIGMQLAAIKSKEKDAIPYLKEGVKFSAQSLSDLLMRAQAFNLTQDYEKSLADCEKILELDPRRETEVACIRREAHSKLGQLDKAKEDDAIIKSAPVNGYITDAGAPPTAASFDRAVAKHPKDAKVYVARAKYYQGRNEARALADYSKALSLKPKDIEILSSRAQYYADLHFYTKALNDISKIMQLSKTGLGPDNDPLILRCEIYERLGQYQNALQDCNKMTAIDDFKVLQRARILIHLGKINEALKDCNSQLHPEDSWDNGAYSTRAAIYNANSEYQKALDDCALGLQLPSNLYGDRYCTERAHAYFGTGKYDDCIENCNAAILLASAEYGDKEVLAEAYHWRAEAERKLGKIDLANKDQSEANKLNSIR